MEHESRAPDIFKGSEAGVALRKGWASPDLLVQAFLIRLAAMEKVDAPQEEHERETLQWILTYQRIYRTLWKEDLEFEKTVRACAEMLADQSVGMREKIAALQKIQKAVSMKRDKTSQ